MEIKISWDYVRKEKDRLCRTSGQCETYNNIDSASVAFTYLMSHPDYYCNINVEGCPIEKLMPQRKLIEAAYLFDGKEN